MKRLLTYAVGLLLLGGISLSIAQNVNKSVQLSQDPSGPIGFDNQNGVYFPGKLYNTNNQTAPTLGGCGTTPSISGTATAGSILEGTGSVSTCQITFAAAFPATPYCFGQSTAQGTPLGVTPTPNGVNFTHAANTTAMRFSYFCFGQQP